MGRESSRLRTCGERGRERETRGAGRDGRNKRGRSERETAGWRSYVFEGERVEVSGLARVGEGRPRGEKCGRRAEHTVEEVGITGRTS